ncbi:MAG: SGNH/GDSL hydrolase family protein [Cytophagales bacterium]|nr:SGNH/GDSL hydrolase family protein [Cytophagales bacterium]
MNTIPLPKSTVTTGVLAALLLLVIPIHPALAQAGPAVPECQTRNGLPGTAARLARPGDTLRIAYLGGSITQAAGGWREQSVAALAGRHPRNPVTHVNAGVGGTGSDLGAFRLAGDVLGHRPDLVFVEFAVNDFKREPAEVEQSVEGIVRQTRRTVPGADLLFVYTLHLASKPFVERGELTPVIAAMERVAGHYGIPSLHFGPAVWALERAGKLVFQGKAAGTETGKLLFSEDGVHPLKEGHAVYAEVVARHFPDLLRKGRARRQLPRPLHANHWGNAQTLPIAQDALRGAWERLTPDTDSLVRKHASRMPVVWRSGGAGAALTVRFRGTRIGIYDLVGPPTGRILVQVDGRPAEPRLRFDKYCTFYRLHYFLLDELPDGMHTVTFSVDAGRPDKAAILEKAPGTPLGAEYEPAWWMPAQVLLVGKPLP